MATSKKAKIKDLKPDDKNFNKHTKFGSELLKKSLSEFGPGRSILIDKNNRIIAGNATAETLAALGGQDVTIVESDGKSLIAVKRTDIDLSTKRGRRFSLADNASAVKNIDLDVVPIVEELGEEAAVEFGMIEDASQHDRHDDAENAPQAVKAGKDHTTFTIALSKSNKSRLVKKLNKVNYNFQYDSLEKSLMHIINKFKL